MRIRPTSVIATLTAVIAAIVLRNVFVAAHRAIGWAVAAALLAMLLLPLAQRLDRHLPRPLALVATVLGLAVAAGLLWAGTRQEIIEEAERIEIEAPRAAAALESRYSWAEKADLTTRVDALLATFETPSPTARVGRAAGTALAYFVPGILTIFLMVYGSRMVEGALALLPEQRRANTRRVLGTTATDVRVQILAALAWAALVGTVAGGLSAMLGLPAPVLLGLIAGGLSVLSAMGIVIGALPVVLLALALDTASTALAVLVVAIALQVLDVVVIRRRVRARAGDVGPALTVLAVLVGFDLYGMGGAIYGFVALVFVMSLVRQLGLEHDRGEAAG